MCKFTRIKRRGVNVERKWNEAATSNCCFLSKSTKCLKSVYYQQTWRVVRLATGSWEETASLAPFKVENEPPTHSSEADIITHCMSFVLSIHQHKAKLWFEGEFCWVQCKACYHCAVNRSGSDRHYTTARAY